MSDLLSALQATLRHAKEGYTVAEICVLAKLPETHTNRLKIRAFLKGEIGAGRITGKMGRRLAIDGAMRTVPVYVPVTKKK